MPAPIIWRRETEADIITIQAAPTGWVVERYPGAKCYPGAWYGWRRLVSYEETVLPHASLGGYDPEVEDELGLWVAQMAAFGRFSPCKVRVLRRGWVHP